MKTTKAIAISRISIHEKMNTLSDPRPYHFYYGGRGGGKTDSVAKYLLREADRKPLIILCARYAQNSINDSVKRTLEYYIKKLQYINYTITSNSIEHTNGTKFIFRGLWHEDKTHSVKSIGKVDYCWLEEGQVIPSSSLDVLIPSIRKPNTRFFFTYNPMTASDPITKFKNSLSDDQKVDVHINFSDNPFLSENFLKLAEAKKREDIDQYRHIYLGETLVEGNNSIFNLSQIREIFEREVIEYNDFKRNFGIDVAKYGDDETVIVDRQKTTINSIVKFSKKPLTYVADYISRNYEKNIIINMDATGVGGGLVDILIQKGYTVIGVENNNKAIDELKYANAFTEMCYNFKNIVQNITSKEVFDVSQFCRTFSYDHKGRIIASSKTEYKKKFGRSPDIADAILLAFYEKQKKTNSGFYVI